MRRRERGAKKMASMAVALCASIESVFPMGGDGAVQSGVCTLREEEQ